MIETRNGSDEVLRQQVYGRGYVDELVQIGINQDPSNANSQSNAENDCERFVYVLQDANYNVLGVATSTGRLIERYEYTPYGQRTIFSHGWLRADIDDDGFVGQGDLDIVLGDWGHTGAGIADPCADLSGDGSVGQADLDIYLAGSGEALASDGPLVSMAVLSSGEGRDGLAAGLCAFGHQGLMHDREFSLLYNRMRYLDPVLARFMTTDPAGYRDGMNEYQYVGSQPVGFVGPSGLKKFTVGPFDFDIPIPTSICYDYKADVVDFKVKNWKRQIIDDEWGMGSVTEQATIESVKENLGAAHKGGMKQDDGSILKLPITGKKECPKGSCCKKLASLKGFDLWMWKHKQYWIDIGWSKKGTVTKPVNFSGVDVRVDFDLGLKLLIDGYIGTCIK